MKHTTPTESEKTSAGPCSRLKHWLAENWSQEVPEDMAVCEFDCSKLECSQADFESCERRIKHRTLGLPSEVKDGKTA